MMRAVHQRYRDTGYFVHGIIKLIQQDNSAQLVEEFQRGGRLLTQVPLIKIYLLYSPCYAIEQLPELRI